MEKGVWKEVKRKYENVIERKKEEERVRFMEEVECAIEEGRVWDLINRMTRTKGGVNNNIKMHEWDVYFKNLLVE